MIRLSFLLGILQLSSIGFSQPEKRTDYPNVLSIQTTVQDTSNVEHSFFSDQGAWFAYSLPNEKKDYGSFIGPLLMKMNGVWLGNAFSKIVLKENGKGIDLSTAKASLNYYPGLISQLYVIDGLEIQMELIFQSKESALIQTKIVNLTSKKRELEIAYQLDPIMKAEIRLLEKNGVIVRTGSSNKTFSIVFPNSLEIGYHNNEINLGKVDLKAKGMYENMQVQSYFPGKIVSNQKNAIVFEAEKLANETRWNGYLNSYFNRSKLVDSDKKKLAVKSIMTLMTNWRSAAGDLLHDGVFPSASYDGFYGFWSWDSWKQAVALSYSNPELAKSNILSLFDYQDKNGMIPDCIYFDKTENNWRDTKPPLATWAVYHYYMVTKDRKFLAEIYPKLVLYHRWWYQNRDCNQNNLCEYGSTDGTLIAAKWESGMDNAVRFDNRKMIQSSESAWSIDLESVDLNTYLYKEKKYLEDLAQSLGDTNEAEQWSKEAQLLKKQINSTFYDSSRGFYYDKTLSGEFVTSEASEGFIPLWAGIADSIQASRVSIMISKSNKFNTFVPFPTVCADHPLFNPLKGYWRGPVWLDQFNFAIVGLNNYKYFALSEELTNKLLKNGEGLLSNQPLRENYHPITGKGLNAINFSWSAAHLLILLNNN